MKAKEVELHASKLCKIINVFEMGETVSLVMGTKIKQRNEKVFQAQQSMHMVTSSSYL